MVESKDGYDLIVIGAGPGGYTAAIRGARAGLRTALLERERLGGVCLNWGCIPTKVMLHSAALWRQMRGARRFGIRADGLQFDYGAIVRRSRQTVERLIKGLELLLKDAGVEVIAGTGRLEGREGERIRVRVEPAGSGGDNQRRALVAPKVILATGGRSSSLPGLAFDGERVLSSRDAIMLNQVPSSMLIIGAGAIGLEFADLFSSFGSKVTVVEMLPRILPSEDEEVSLALRSALVKRGIRILTSSVVEGAEPAAEGLLCHVRPVEDEAAGIGGFPGQLDSQGNSSRQKDSQTGGSSRQVHSRGGLLAAQDVEVDRVLVAVGVSGVVDGLGLETLGVSPEHGFVKVDGHLRTCGPGLYAIGDLTGPPLLAHAASSQGVHAAEHAASSQGMHAAEHAATSHDVHGPEHSTPSHGVHSAGGASQGDLPEYDPRWTPAAVFTHPQVASVGLREQDLEKEGLQAKVGRFPFSASGRAVAEGEVAGFVKVLIDEESGRLLGAHVIGPVASELIAELTLAGRSGVPAAELIRTIHAHPTFSEAVQEAFGKALGMGIHG